MMPGRGKPAGDTRTGKERPPSDPTEVMGHGYVLLFHAVAVVAIAGTISEAGEVKGRGTRAARGGATQSYSYTYTDTGQFPGRTGYRLRPGLTPSRASPARSWLRAWASR